jgi:hypothetical protein
MDHQAFAQLLGNYGEFVGAVAVVATLAYLAVQIRQSNVAAQAASIQAFFAAFNSFADVKQDVTFIQVIRKGFAGWEGLSQDEQVQVHMYWSQYLSNLHMGYRLYRRGVLDRGSYSGFEDYFLSVLQTPGIRGWWAEHGPIFPEDFRDRMADRLRNASKKPARITELYPTMWATR